MDIRDQILIRLRSETLRSSEHGSFPCMTPAQYERIVDFCTTLARDAEAGQLRAQRDASGERQGDSLSHGTDLR